MLSPHHQLLRRPDLRGQLRLLFPQGPEVAFNLDPVPEVLGLSEEGAEANRHGRGDGPFPQYDLVDGPRRHSDRTRHRVLGDAHGLEVFLEQDFAGGDVHGYNV